MQQTTENKKQAWMTREKVRERGERESDAI